MIEVLNSSGQWCINGQTSYLDNSCKFLLPIWVKDDDEEEAINCVQVFKKTILAKNRKQVEADYFVGLKCD